MVKRTKSPKKSASQLKFYQKLVLNRFLLQQFGVDDFKELSNDLKNPSLESIDEEGVTGFYTQIALLPQILINKDKLAEYDLNIVSHLRKINDGRHNAIRLKYFQYLSLLFTEYYLDQFFNHKEELLNGLNAFVEAFNAEYPADTINAYEESDLNKLALWNATGSGKTFLMHINYHQYIHHAGKIDKNSMFVLITPNEGLSIQHLEEFKDSSISAKIFDKYASRAASSFETIHILESSKLKEKDGVKSLAVSSFSDNNIVFVDEGHRGASGDTWMENRKALCENGFSFEYSATFGQAVSSKAALLQEYAKCILFDYSYKYFYNDGFGKDYSITNYPSNEDSVNRKLYLTGAMLTFYQQKKYYLDKKSEVAAFNLENPLFVFVGTSVIKQNSLTEKDKKQLSDILDILIFIREFTQEPELYTDFIHRLLQGNAILDTKDTDIFRGAFLYIMSLQKEASALYQDICKVVFNCSTSHAVLHLEELSSNGEIQISLGENRPFGLINVGDSSGLRKLCDKHEFFTSKASLSDSLFQGLNSANSTINILIGSKKFTEGWNSWRVGTMGLMNMGRNEGSNIIQLFGRGVRLKGYGMSLKRSKKVIGVVQGLNIPKHLQTLETLNIFGVRADYMVAFKEMLENEGDPKGKDAVFTITMPVVRNQLYKKAKLLTLKLKQGLDYKKNAPKPYLEYRSDVSIDLDCYAKVQFEKSNKTDGSSITKEKSHLEAQHLALLDYDAIYFALQDYKREKAHYYVNITVEKLRELLQKQDWYTLYIPREDLEIKSIMDVKRIESIVIALLKKYFERLYYVDKNKWEKPLLELLPMDDNDVNFLKEEEYTITASDEVSYNNVCYFVSEIEKEIKKAGPTISGFARKLHSLGAVSFDSLMYRPFLYVDSKSKEIAVAPVALNEGEYEFMDDLRDYFAKQKDYFADKELYIIRNKSKKGIGFFKEKGFYPDFIMWVVHNGKQYMTFIDPHGMRNTSLYDAKVQLYKDIKDIQKTLDDNVILNSFILSPTPYKELPEKKEKDEWNARHVLFMAEKSVDDGYIKAMFEKIL